MVILPLIVKLKYIVNKFSWNKPGPILTNSQSTVKLQKYELNLHIFGADYFLIIIFLKSPEYVRRSTKLIKLCINGI